MWWGTLVYRRGHRRVGSAESRRRTHSGSARARRRHGGTAWSRSHVRREPQLFSQWRLVGHGELDQARAILEALRPQPQRAGKRARRQLDGSLGRLEWFAGKWELALDHVRQSEEYSDSMRHHRSFMGRIRALAEADLGSAEAARASAAIGLEAAEEMSDREFVSSFSACSAASSSCSEMSRQRWGTSATFPDSSCPLDRGSHCPDLGRRYRGADRRRGARFRPWLLDAYEANAHRVGSPWAAPARCAAGASSPPPKVTGQRRS